MIIFLSELQKEHLKIVIHHSTQLLIDFCKLAIDFLNNGINDTKYSAAAEKLHVSSNDIQNSVYALVFLLVEACKHNLSESDFKSSLTIAGFSSEHQDVLVKLFNKKKADLSECLYLLQQKDPTYQHLTWRMEVELASRDCHEKVKPTVALDFVLMTPKNFDEDNTIAAVHFNTSSDKRNYVTSLQIDNSIHDAKTASQCQNVINHVLLGCDLPNLVHMTNKLDQALKESKSQHVRKVKSALIHK